MNEFLFIIHFLFLQLLGLFALRLGKIALGSYICLTFLMANFFVLKQMTLFGLQVTASDGYAICGMLSLNFMQEFFGKKAAKEVIIASFLIFCIFVSMSFFHLMYIPNNYDTMQSHYESLLKLMPRLFIASISAYFLSQLFDFHLFSRLKQIKKISRVILYMMCLVSSQIIDTVVFAFIGLWGVAFSLSHVIIFGLITKLILVAISPLVIFLSSQFKYRIQKQTFEN